MTRDKAIMGTALIAAGGFSAAWLYDRWPEQTLIGLSLLTIYAKLRQVPDHRTEVPVGQ